MAPSRSFRLTLPACCITIVAATASISLGVQPSPPATQPAAPTSPATRPSGDGRVDRIAEIVANAVDKRHGGQQYRGHTVLQCDIALESGDVAYQGTLSFQVNGQSARFDFKNGSAIVFDGTTCWTAGEWLTSHTALKRLLALRHLVAAPFMAHDSGTKIRAYRATMVAGSDADSYRVQWAGGGWPESVDLVAYANVRTRLLNAIGSDALPALLGLPDGDHAPRAIVFDDVQTVDGAALPMAWSLYEWTDAAGVKGEPKGAAKIANARFVRGDEVQFNAPKDAPKSSSADNH